MSENAVLDAIELHQFDPIDPRGMTAKNCVLVREQLQLKKCLSVFRCKRCWPMVK